MAVVAVTKLYDTPIIARYSLPPRLPAIHPFTIWRKVIRYKHWRVWFYHVLCRGKPVISRKYYLASKLLNQEARTKFI